jgi:hypothetical protein
VLAYLYVALSMTKGARKGIRIAFHFQ